MNECFSFFNRAYARINAETQGKMFLHPIVNYDIFIEKGKPENGFTPTVI